MGFQDIFWGACNFLIDTTIHNTATALDNVGKLASVLSGAGLTLAYIDNRNISGGYYGNVDVPAAVQVNVSNTEFKKSFVQNMSFVFTKEQSDHLILKDFISPDYLALSSFGLLIVGTLCRTVSANLKVYQKGRESKAFSSNKYSRHVIHPSIMEYIYANGQAITSSVNYMCFGSILTGAIFFTKRMYKDYLITFPFGSTSYSNNSDYNGPLYSKEFREHLHLKENTTLDLTSLHIKIHFQEQENIDIPVNITAGGGVELSKKIPGPLPAITPFIIGTISVVANSMFKSLKHKEEIDRLNPEPTGYVTVMSDMN